MSHFTVIVFSVLLILLVLLSAFFSGAETGLMAVNRYRLRHRARIGRKNAMLILKLLKRPDRVLGLLLIGNSVANIVSAAIATLLAVYFFGDKGVVVSTILLTLAILIFAEAAPKTIAALYPDQVTKIIAWPVTILLNVLYPIVWLVNCITNGLLRLFGIKVGIGKVESLSREELRTIVSDTTGRLSRQYQSMLLGILDLNKATVDDVMIPGHEIRGIDINQEWDMIQKQIAASQHDWLPVYRDNINQVIGFLHLRDYMGALVNQNVMNKDKLQRILQEPYFIPEGAPLNIQLLHFQRQRKRIALIVDEYGEVTGLVALTDILEEIVGEFTTTVTANNKVIETQTDGSFLVDGAITVRELNRVTEWELPTRGPRTLSGLIIEHLEAMPVAGVCVKIANYPIEIMEVKDNRVKIARVFPRLADN